MCHMWYLLCMLPFQYHSRVRALLDVELQVRALLNKVVSGTGKAAEWHRAMRHHALSAFMLESCYLFHTHLVITFACHRGQFHLLYMLACACQY
jgi:hypothetical protein